MREFTPFPKLVRLTKDVIVTEKIDGTNAAVVVTDYGDVYAQSRNRVLSLTEDNYGFAKWVSENTTELAEKLGVGVHFGEWWGSGIQRGYGLKEKRFSLFATHKFQGDPNNEYRCFECPICFVVPVLGTTAFGELDETIGAIFNELKRTGSLAAPGFDNPEGIVLCHTASKTLYKHTYEFSNGKWAG